MFFQFLVFNLAQVWGSFEKIIVYNLPLDHWMEDFFFSVCNFVFFFKAIIYMLFCKNCFVLDCNLYNYGNTATPGSLIQGSVSVFQESNIILYFLHLHAYIVAVFYFSISSSTLAII